MRTLARVFGIVLILHALAAIGFVGWLIGTDRVDQDRVDAVVAIFKQTLGEEKAAAKAADDEAKKKADADARLANLEARAEGPETTIQRLARERQMNEITLRRIERVRQEIASLKANLTTAQATFEREKEKLAADRKAFDAEVAARKKQLEDEGFRKAVELYEGLPAKQTKQMFASMMGQGQTDTVVAYLNAMEPRKATSVLKEFKVGADVKMATDLTERLRKGGNKL